MHLASPANPRLKAIAKLADKKHRDETGLFWLEGEGFVRRALDDGWQPDTLLVAEGHAFAAPHETTTAAALSKITGKSNPQPVLGVFRQKWEGLPAKPSGLWLALDRPRDPGNLGTILRTADATAVEGVVLVGEATDPYGPECVRATMGSILSVPLVKTDAASFLRWAKPLVVIGTHLKGPLDYRKLPDTRPAVLLMGNESHGLPEDLAAACTHLARIPMRGHTESLNLASATAVMLYQLQQKVLA